MTIQTFNNTTLASTNIYVQSKVSILPFSNRTSKEILFFKLYKYNSECAFRRYNPKFLIFEVL